MNPTERDWQDDATKKLDLELENRSLELDQKLQGAISWKSDDIDPEIHNAFLHYVNTYEDLSKQPQRPIKSLFPEDFVFPPIDSLTEAQLAEKLDTIYEILDTFGIEVQLQPDLPDTIIYKYLIEEVIPNETTLPENGLQISHVIDGCSGGCEDCFQAEYCDTRDETYGDEGKQN
jgi:hypothetical protein